MQAGNTSGEYRGRQKARETPPNPYCGKEKTSWEKSKYIESNSLTDIKKIIDDSLEILFHIIIIDRFGRIAYINDNYCAFSDTSVRSSWARR